MLRRMSRALSIVPYELVDIGANLGHPSYKNDLEQVLERAQKAGNLLFLHLSLKF